MCTQCPDYTPVIFEHRDYGTLVVASMIDVDNEITDNVELAMQVMCPLSNGNWLAACVSEGTLIQVGRLN